MKYILSRIAVAALALALMAPAAKAQCFGSGAAVFGGVGYGAVVPQTFVVVPTNGLLATSTFGYGGLGYGAAFGSPFVGGLGSPFIGGFGRGFGVGFNRGFNRGLVATPFGGGRFRQRTVIRR